MLTTQDLVALGQGVGGRCPASGGGVVVECAQRKFDFLRKKGRAYDTEHHCQALLQSHGGVDGRVAVLFCLVFGPSQHSRLETAIAACFGG